MTVPRLLLITDRRLLPAGRGLESTVAECVSAGVRHVLLRERDLEPAAHQRLLRGILELLAPVGGTLIVASPAAAVPPLRVGVHLRSTDAFPPSRPHLVGRSVHGPDGAARATREGCDFVTLAPVFATASKPGYGPALGADGVRRLLHAVPRCPPVLALGGVEPQLVPALRAAGAHGVAVMGSVMRSSDPGAVVHRLLNALDRSCDSPKPDS